MRKDQLDILLKHGDIWSETMYKNYRSKNKAISFEVIFPIRNSIDPWYKLNKNYPSSTSLNINGAKYYISLKLYTLLDIIFEWYLGNYLMLGHLVFNEGLRKKLERWPTEKEYIIKIYNKIMCEKFEQIENIVGEIDFFNDPNWVRRYWFSEILENQVAVIEKLKFDVFKGEKLENVDLTDIISVTSPLFPYPEFTHGSSLDLKNLLTVQLKNTFQSLMKLDKYFKTLKMKYAYCVLANDEIIFDLKDKVANLNQAPDEKKVLLKEVEKIVPGKKEKGRSNKEFVYKEIAIAYNILGKHFTRDEAKNILFQHSHQRSISELMKAQRKNRYLKEAVKLRGVQTADTKHLKVLMATERLINLIGNESHKIDISRILSVFKTTYYNAYQKNDH